MTPKYRPIKEEEHSFLAEMLYQALFVPAGHSTFPKSIVETPEVRKYVEKWGQEKNDIAIVAVKEGELIGAIWGRTFSVHKKGYGFVDEDTPEISMAVSKEFRNRGIGSALLAHIETEYAKRGIETLSLSVDKQNPAKRLYERYGYRIFAEQETAITMLKKI